MKPYEYYIKTLDSGAYAICQCLPDVINGSGSTYRYITPAIQQNPDKPWVDEMHLSRIIEQLNYVVQPDEGTPP